LRRVRSQEKELEGAVERGEEDLLEGFMTECVSEYTEL
jgi:hypothetical protein